MRWGGGILETEKKKGGFGCPLLLGRPLTLLRCVGQEEKWEVNGGTRKKKLSKKENIEGSPSAREAPGKGEAGVPGFLIRQRQRRGRKNVRNRCSLQDLKKRKGTVR